MKEKEEVLANSSELVKTVARMYEPTPGAIIDFDLLDKLDNADDTVQTFNMTDEYLLLTPESKPFFGVFVGIGTQEVVDTETAELKSIETARFMTKHKMYSNFGVQLVRVCRNLHLNTPVKISLKEIKNKCKIYNVETVLFPQ